MGKKKYWLDDQDQRFVVNGVKSTWQSVTGGAPQAQFWGLSHLTSALMIWAWGLSAPSVNMQMTLSWLGMLICLTVERLCRDQDRLDQRAEHSCRRFNEVKCQVCSLVTTTPEALQAGGGMA